MRLATRGSRIRNRTTDYACDAVVVSDDGGDEALELEAEREPACGVEHEGASGDVLVDGDGVTYEAVEDARRVDGLRTDEADHGCGDVLRHAERFHSRQDQVDALVDTERSS